MNIKISTSKKREVIDITKHINKVIEKLSAEEGVCFLFLTHTTASLTTADLDPGTDLDMLDAFEKMVPKLNYRHPHNPEHTSDHILSALVGTSLSIPFSKNGLILGTWQRVVLFEFDGPRERNIEIKVVKEIDWEF